MTPWEYITIIKAPEVPRLWKNKQREKKKLAEKRAKKQAKAQEKGLAEKVKKEDQTIPLDTVITLDHLTNPDKNNY